MTHLIRKVIDEYHVILDNKGDPRTTTWFLMSSPLPTLAIVLGYLIFVTRVGPALMKNRKPFELNNMLIVYNAFQVVLSTWLFVTAAVNGWFTSYSFICEPVDFSNNPAAVTMAHVVWWYFISKFTEFFDTIFFVLRKKNKQITTLHVVHHGIMPISVWIGVKFFAGGQITFFGFINTFVHIIMYSYYLLAALGPRMQPYLWWKRYLTQLQMVQFILIIVHSMQTLVIECNIPKGLMQYIMAHGLLFLILFSNFYYRSYMNKKTKYTLTKGFDSLGDVALEQGRPTHGRT